jgi:hypothetical protein
MEFPATINQSFTEIEKVFNGLRYQYLQAVLKNRKLSPGELLSANFNQAFQELCGIPVYQGNAKHRKPRGSFLKEAGFEGRIDCDKEVENLSSALLTIKKFLASQNDTILLNRVYTELIAIKPGFHEIWVHGDFFKEEFKENPKSNEANHAKSRVLNMLRNKAPLRVVDIGLTKFPSYQINKKLYISYASCAFTEGPFVRRRDDSISYFDEIRKIKSPTEKLNLKEKFYIRDYQKIKTRDELATFVSSVSSEL